MYACRGDTGVPLGTWLAHTDAVSAVEAFGGAPSAQTIQLLTASWDGSIKLWQCVCHSHYHGALAAYRIAATNVHLACVDALEADTPWR